MRKLSSIVLMCILISGGSAFAQEAASQLALQTTASFVTARPGSMGGSFMVALALRPFAERRWMVAPRVGVLWSAGNEMIRRDFNSGVESVLWLFNALGPGMGADVVAPSSADRVHFRYEPFFTMRFKRMAETGAWAMRIGATYDTLFKWGFAAGLSLQWSGA